MTSPIYLTGADGFIGSFFREKCNTLPICSIPRSVVCGGENLRGLKKGSVLVHLAARVHVMKETAETPLDEFRKINTDLTFRIAKEAIQCGVRKFIFLSSVSVFGRLKGGFIADTLPPVPDDPYGLSKFEAEQGLSELFKNQTTSQCIILRSPMIYGPGNKGNMLPLLRASSKRLQLPLGKTKGQRSLLYVANLCAALVKIINDETLDRPAVQTYFLSDGQDITSGELYSGIFREMHGKSGVFPVPEKVLRLAGKAGAVVEKTMGRSLPINNRVLSRLFDEYRFSNQKFCADYGWSPPYTVKEGIKDTVEWYLDRESLKSAVLSGKKEKES
jgi:nucleoside-diphosphate-sugar epimerase